MNNEVITDLATRPMPETGIQSSAANSLRPGHYLVSSSEKARMSSLFGPFSCPVVAGFMHTSARSLGLVTPD